MPLRGLPGDRVSDDRGSPWGVALLLVAGALLVLTACIGAGLHAFELGGVRVFSRSAVRPLMAAAAVLAFYAYRFRGTFRADIRMLASPRAIATLAAVAALAIGLLFADAVAGGSDAYGYVSQADLWQRGELVIDSPLSYEAQWPHSASPFAPLGYWPGQRRGTMVPTYSPGLPMAMALLKTLFGPPAVYWVVPLLAALSILLTFRLGAFLAGEEAGALAAVMLLASPVFLLHSVMPMSDVPAMTWWLLSTVLALAATPVLALCSGIAAAAAILTRPNLAPLAALVFVLTAAPPARHPRWMRAGTWLLGVVPGVAIVAAINAHLYGSPLRSGYGGLGDIFASGDPFLNVKHWGLWTFSSQTPLFLAGVAAPWLLARRAESRHGVPLASWCLVFALTLCAIYAWYTPYDGWAYLRFLLPAWPMLAATAAAVLVAVSGPPRPGRRAILASVGAILLAFGLWQARERGVFTVAAADRRYVNAARYVTTHLPQNAAVLSTNHSGSLRFYAHMLTVRYEWIDGPWLGEATSYLRRSGRSVYAVLDEPEREAFRRKFGDHSDVTWLDREPLARLDGNVYVYEVPESAASAGASGK